MTIEIRLLGPSDHGVLERTALDVFDHPIDPTRTAEFLRDPRHHIVVAIDLGIVVGFVSAVHYVHPDKPLPELWINEVSVAPTHRRQGVAASLLGAMLEEARRLDCGEAWVLTDRSNLPAMGLYARIERSLPPTDHVMFTFEGPQRRDGAPRAPR